MTPSLRFAMGQPWLLRPAVMNDLGNLLVRHVASGAGVERASEAEVAAIVGARDRAREGKLSGRRSIGMMVDGDGVGSGEDLNPRADLTGGFEVPVHVTASGVAVMAMDGLLCKWASMVNGVSQPPGTPHAAAVAAMDRLTAMGARGMVRGCVLHCDSPGGTCAGHMDLAAAMERLSRAMPTVAFANDQACSGMYWIAAMCDQVVLSSMASVGSIGAFNYVDDSSEAFKKMGITRTIVGSNGEGGIKGQGTEGTPVSAEYIEQRNDEMRQYAGKFVDAVASGRGVAREKALSWATGRVWIGAQAVTAGLADRVIETLPEVVRYVERELIAKAA